MLRLSRLGQLGFLVLLAALSLGGGPARAEGGTCPPGFYPAGGIGFVGCAPIPGYDSGGDYGYGDDYGNVEYEGPIELIENIVSLFTPKKKGVPADAAPAQPAQPESAPVQAMPQLPPMPPGAKGVYMTAEGVWLLFEQNNSCVAVFGSGGKTLVFSGPAGKNPGGITFMGPSVPPISEPAEVELTLTADGKPVKVRGLHLPGGATGMLIVPAVIEDTMASIGDSEKVAVKLKGKTVFSVQTVGAHSARDALLDCLG